MTRSSQCFNYISGLNHVFGHLRLFNTFVTLQLSWLGRQSPLHCCNILFQPWIFVEMFSERPAIYCTISSSNWNSSSVGIPFSLITSRFLIILPFPLTSHLSSSIWAYDNMNEALTAGVNQPCGHDHLLLIPDMQYSEKFVFRLDRPRLPLWVLQATFEKLTRFVLVVGEGKLSIPGQIIPGSAVSAAQPARRIISTIQVSHSLV